MNFPKNNSQARAIRMVLGDDVVLRAVMGGLQKGVPVRPQYVRLIRVSDSDSNYLCGGCKDHHVVRADKYCSECGQRIDWVGVED